MANNGPRRFEKSSIGAFPICVTAFMAKSEEEQRSQFILVNSTKPLPKGLIYELLPATERDSSCRAAAASASGPTARGPQPDAGITFFGLIATPTTPDGVIKDNSILRMLDNSITDGMLNQLRLDPSDAESINLGANLVTAFWSAVKASFPDAWGVDARKSRLMHGVGIVSLGFVMDAIAERYLPTRTPQVADFEADLVPLIETCRWTSGYWEFGPNAVRRWNELQNTSRDLQLLANYLLFEYRRRVLMPASERRAYQSRLFAGVNSEGSHD